MKNIKTSIALFTVAALGLTACGNSGGASDESGGETLSVWIMDGGVAGTEAFFDDVKKQFADETGATLDVQLVQWGEAHDRFVTSIAGNTTPDVAEIGTTWTPEFAAAGALAPLDEQMASAGLGKGYVDALVKAGTLDGSLYGAPWYVGTRSVVYRADIFENLGLEEPKTWDELVETGLAIKEERPNMVQYAVPGADEKTLYPFIWGKGAKIATQNGDTWTSGLAKPEAREGVEFFTDLAIEHDLSSAGGTTWDQVDVIDNFAQGNVAMAVLGSWATPTILKQNPDLENKLGAFPIPGPDGGYSPSLLGGSHLSMFESSDNPELAWDFIEMMTTGDLAAEWAEHSNYFPAQKSLVEELAKSEDPLVKPFAKQMLEAGATVPVSPKWGKVEGQKTMNAMVQSILSGDKTVDQATEDAAAEVEELLNGN